MGSRVTVRAGAANKDLVRVQVDTASSTIGPCRSRCSKRSDLAADRRGFSYALAPLMKDTTLLFTLTDTDGIKSRDPVRLALAPLPDQPPQMAVQLDGIGTADHAAGPHARRRAASPTTTASAACGSSTPSTSSKPAQSCRFAALPPIAPRNSSSTDAALEVRELGLKPGQKLLVSVKAADLCDLGQGPNVAGSERWLLDVVTPEQLRAMLESRELVLRQRFERIIQEMTETRDLLARLEFGCRRG